MLKNIPPALIALWTLSTGKIDQWYIFDISKGIDAVELIYNYVYVFITLIALALNIKLIYNSE